jgi:NAD-dependent dihydropyrimidine dehydrogenase PreA subunit
MEEDTGDNIRMFKIDSTKCNACGSCIEVCRQQAIAIHDGAAVINQRLCTECGTCLEICPAGAIKEMVLAQSQNWKGGGSMVYGFGGGFGRRGGAGLGFRGTSSPWPYIGRGRGGLPRCWYPGLRGGATPYIAPSEASYWAAPTTEGDLGFLKNQADIMKSQLEEIEHRIQELEKKD